MHKNAVLLKEIDIFSFEKNSRMNQNKAFLTHKLSSETRF